VPRPLGSGRAGVSSVITGEFGGLLVLHATRALQQHAVLSLMRRHPQAREIPVVACTALASAGDQERIRLRVSTGT